MLYMHQHTLFFTVHTMCYDTYTMTMSELASCAVVLVMRFSRRHAEPLVERNTCVCRAELGFYSSL